jgi:hypothetical protein
VTNPQKRKGDKAELEAARLLSDLLGYDVKRALGAGRAEDCGDLFGIPQTVVQVKNFKNVAVAVTAAKNAADEQARNAGVPFRFGMVRHPGGTWTCVMSPEALATMLREALA